MHPLFILSPPSLLCSMPRPSRPSLVPFPSLFLVPFPSQFVSNPYLYSLVGLIICKYFVATDAYMQQLTHFTVSKIDTTKIHGWATVPSPPQYFGCGGNRPHGLGAYDSSSSSSSSNLSHHLLSHVT